MHCFLREGTYVDKFVRARRGNALRLSRERHGLDVH